MPNAKISIRTCSFQCGSFSEDYYICDDCRDNSLLNYMDQMILIAINCYIIEEYVKDKIISLITDESFILILL